MRTSTLGFSILGVPASAEGCAKEGFEPSRGTGMPADERECQDPMKVVSSPTSTFLTLSLDARDRRACRRESV